MIISGIFARTQNGLIGVDNDIPWHISEDLKLFKDTTFGHAVAMGRKTWESLGSHPLPNRTNIVITRSDIEVPAGVAVVKSIFDAVKWCTDLNAEYPFTMVDELFYIGGANILKQCVDQKFIERWYITTIPVDMKVDTGTYFTYDPMSFYDGAALYVRNDELSRINIPVKNNIVDHIDFEVFETPFLSEFVV